ncbi:hypothetical protein L210DRAFT_3531467 [Boletus edulis BED1]|uniref:Uncharacterized protein n=1 Tax=Boletus edulis BED1 TaxID=1328754 RepID=A0AAD4C134_BOLED|nr:hypothetical protein L210DRAFT_3531467 [Boletus edulis BED1]
MTHFKHVFSRFLRPKSRRQFRQRGAITPTATNVVTSGEPSSLRGRAHHVPESTDQNIVQPLADAVVEDVEESEGESESEARNTHLAVDAHSVQPSTDTILTKTDEVEQHQDGDSHDEYDDEYDDDDDDDDEGDDVPEVISCDLARKTHCTKIIQRLYVAVTDDDCEIAALQTIHPKQFTHIVRVAFDPPSDKNNIMPSSWKLQVNFPKGGPHEVRLTCPALTLQYDGKRTALKEKQLRAARNVIANDAWSEEDPKFPIPLDLCKKMRLLVIAPPDRSVDAMTIVVCYMAFLTGQSAEETLGAFQRTLRRAGLARSHWAGDILGRESLDMANVVSKQKW